MRLGTRRAKQQNIWLAPLSVLILHTSAFDVSLNTLSLSLPFGQHIHPISRRQVRLLGMNHQKTIRRRNADQIP